MPEPDPIDTDEPVDSIVTAFEFEHMFLAAVMDNPEIMPWVAERITPAAFLATRHAHVWRAILACWKKGETPSLPTVYYELGAAQVNVQREGLGLAELAMFLGPQFVYGHQAPALADRVVDLARARALEDAGARLMIAAHTNPDTDAGALVAETMAQMDTFGARAGAGPREYEEMTDWLHADILLRFAGEKGSGQTITTGFPRLNRLLAGGFQRGSMITLGARPGMGKSALGLLFAHHAARAGHRAVIFSQEMSMESMLYRAAAEVSRVSPRFLDTHRNEHGELERFSAAVDFMHTLPVAVDDTSGLSVDDMIARCQRLALKRPLDLIVFDYLELAGDANRGDNEVQRVSAISRKCKHMARVTNAAVIVLSQLNRGLETRSDQRPRLADLRQSGGIEADSDVVLFLYREDYYVKLGTIKHSEMAEDAAELIVAKHRNGPTGRVPLRFLADTMTFDEIGDGA